jgi:hypothetical protein
MGYGKLDYHKQIMEKGMSRQWRKLMWDWRFSQYGEYGDGYLLGCCIVYSGRSLPTFLRCLLPQSSGWSKMNAWVLTKK